MKIRYAKAEVRLSETHTRPVTLAEWELPILQAVHGTAVTITGETVEKEVDHLPDAGDEFARLAARYRGESGGDTPYVAMVYGTFGPGIAKLAEAIERAVVKAEKPRKAKSKNTVKEPPAKKEPEDNLEALLNEDGE